MEYQQIIYTKEKYIAKITLNRPDRMNAFSREMSASLQRAVTDAAEDSEIRVLIITGAGRAFCAGGDVQTMAEGLDKRGHENEAEDPSMEGIHLYPLVHKFEKPTIAAINGETIGGGLDLALACDIRIASDRAQFSEAFIRRGLMPAGGGTYVLPRLVGIDKACQLIWTGDMIDAQEAGRIGLVTMVVPYDELESTTYELAEKVARNSPLAIQRAKRAIYQGLNTDLSSALDYATSVLRELRYTEDYAEGMKAFTEKREPVFKGR